MDGEDRIFLEADSGPVRRFLNKLLLQGLEQGYEKISIQRAGGQIRVTGDNIDLESADSEIVHGVVCRLKIMAALDVSEIMLVQTGKIELTVQDRPVTLEVRTLPDFFEGEGVVMTLLQG